jgi:hypothetical protein
LLIHIVHGIQSVESMISEEVFSRPGRDLFRVFAVQSVKSLWLTPSFGESLPQGLKPRTNFAAFTARLKSCPFKATASAEFFRSL